MEELPTADVRKLVGLLDSYCPDSINHGEPQPIVAGHAIHSAIVQIEGGFADSKLPPDAREIWHKLLISSRNRQSQAFVHASELRRWIALHLLNDYSGENLTETQQEILEALRGLGRPVRGSEIADLSGYKHDTVRRQLPILVKGGLLQKTKQGYSLPSIACG